MSKVLTWKTIEKDGKIIVEKPVLNDKGKIKFYTIAFKYLFEKTLAPTAVKITYPPMEIGGIYANEADETDVQGPGGDKKTNKFHSIPEEFTEKDYTGFKYTIKFTYDVPYESAIFNPEHKEIMDKKYKLFYLPAREAMINEPKLCYFDLEPEPNPKVDSKHFVPPIQYPRDKEKRGQIIPDSSPVQYIKLKSGVYNGKSYKPKFYKASSDKTKEPEEIPWHLIQRSKCKIIPTTIIERCFCKTGDKSWFQEKLDHAIVLSIEPYDNTKLTASIMQNYLQDNPEYEDSLNKQIDSMKKTSIKENLASSSQSKQEVPEKTKQIVEQKFFPITEDAKEEKKEAKDIDSFLTS